MAHLIKCLNFWLSQWQTCLVAPHHCFEVSLSVRDLGRTLLSTLRSIVSPLWATCARATVGLCSRARRNNVVAGRGNDSFVVCRSGEQGNLLSCRGSVLELGSDVVECIRTMYESMLMSQRLRSNAVRYLAFRVGNAEANEAVQVGYLFTRARHRNSLDARNR